MISTTDQFLTEVRKRLEAATPGPWQKNGTGTIICDLTEDCQHTVISTAKTAGWRNMQSAIDADFTLIASAPQDLARLIEIVEVLRAVCDPYNPSARDICALMAEGEGSNPKTYQTMAWRAMRELDEALAKADAIAKGSE